MAVRYNGPEGTREFKLRVRPGPEGLAVFKAHLKEILGFDVGPEFDVTFECQMPATGSLVTLTGLNAYGAATHCAALLAASKAGGTAAAVPTAASAAPATGISSPSSSPSRQLAPATGATAGAPATGSYSGRPATTEASPPAAPAAQQASSPAAPHPQQPLPAVSRPPTTVAFGGPGHRACQTGYTALQTSPSHRYSQRGTTALYGSAPARGCNSRGARHVLYGTRGRAKFAGRSASDTAVGGDSRNDFDDEVDDLLPYGCRAVMPEATSPLPPLDGWTTAAAAAAAAAAGARGGAAAAAGHQGCPQLPPSPAPTAARSQPGYSAVLGYTSLSGPPSPWASAPASRASDRRATVAPVDGGAGGGGSALAATSGSGQVVAASAAAAAYGSASRQQQPQPHQEAAAPQRESSSGRLRLPSVLRSTARRTMNSLIRALRHSAK